MKKGNNSVDPQSVGNDYSNYNQLESKKAIKRHRRIKTAISILILLILLLLLWGGIYNMADVNSYKIRVDGGYKGKLSLSFEKEFKNGFSVLKGLGVSNAQNAEGTGYSEGVESYINKVVNGDLDMDIQNGGQAGKAEANGNDEYIVSRFYLKNIEEVGGESVLYKIRIEVHENTKNALSAARFMIVKDIEDAREMQAFAQPAEDGSQEKLATKYKGSDIYYKDPLSPDTDWLCDSLQRADDGTWYYDSYEMDSVLYTLDPTQFRGYCIAVWYEGSDPEHTNAIIGGHITFSVTFVTV